MSCSNCGRIFKYTVLTNQNVPTPFFYSTGGKSILLRRSDETIVANAFADGTPEVDELQALWFDILKAAPSPPEGGTFEFWSNVKCPECGYEFPYNKGYRNVGLRIFEPKIIAVDGVTIVGDTCADSFVVRVEVP